MKNRNANGNSQVELPRSPVPKNSYELKNPWNKVIPKIAIPLWTSKATRCFGRIFVLSELSRDVISTN